MNKNKIADSILSLADSIEEGVFKSNITIAVTNFGSELGIDNINNAIMQSKSQLFNIIVVGEPLEGFESYEACGDDEVAKVLKELFDEKKIDAAVTMHYPFPIGVSTVGKVVTPAMGKEMYIATTTGSADGNSIKAMIFNAINGIIVAKANGIENPTVGILNIEGARIVEKKLSELSSNGFDINFIPSKRSDGSFIMRGNDLVAGTPDIMVCDSLTGNIVIKMFSAFQSGGFYETTGYGYGPSVGHEYDKAIFIISRASGTPLIKNAIKFAYESVSGDIIGISKSLYKMAKESGLDEIIKSIDEKKKDNIEDIKIPEAEIVTESIGGIDILEIDDAVLHLWKNEIYAESAMGCTGPIVMISNENLEKAKQILEKAKFI
jgi:hypothetical protein